MSCMEQPRISHLLLRSGSNFGGLIPVFSVLNYLHWLQRHLTEACMRPVFMRRLGAISEESSPSSPKHTI